MPEIKLDRTTLPDHGQRVKWITLRDDMEDGEWKEGTFHEDEQDYKFIMSNSKSIADYDDAWDVVSWKPLN